MNEEGGLWSMSVLFFLMSAPTGSLFLIGVSAIFLSMGFFAHRENIGVNKESEVEK